MRVLLSFIVGFVALAGAGAVAEKPEFQFPLIEEHGGIVATPQAAEPPRRGAKVIFDITVDSKPAEVNKGLANVARYLNLNAAAGHKPSDVQLALVLHGHATRIALGNEGYAKHADGVQNPNLELIQQLKKHGVELFVCGQSLARNQMQVGEVCSDVQVAVSAMTVNVNKQQDGYSYLAIH